MRRPAQRRLILATALPLRGEGRHAIAIPFTETYRQQLTAFFSNACQDHGHPGGRWSRRCGRPSVRLP